jgi:hypothetical protein
MTLSSATRLGRTSSNGTHLFIPAVLASGIGVFQIALNDPFVESSAIYHELSTSATSVDLDSLVVNGLIYFMVGSSTVMHLFVSET